MTNRSRLSRFILADDVASLKIVFDNLKNYALVGALLLAVRWQWDWGTANASPPTAVHGLAFGLALIVSALMILNVFQTLEIGSLIHQAIRAGMAERRSARGTLVTGLLWLAELAALALNWGATFAVVMVGIASLLVGFGSAH